jgi:uncharacterized protein YecT (DUF1311 family)
MPFACVLTVLCQSWRKEQLPRLRIHMRQFLKLVAVMMAFSTPAWADDKPDCENGSQMELNACAAQDFQNADDELNAIWPKVKQFAADGDDALDGDMKGYSKALLASQRAWIAYRDGQCELYGFQSRGGSMESMLVSGCKAQMTTARVKELNDIMNVGQ